MSTTVGLDIGGTKINGGVVDSNGKVIARARRETPAQDADAIAHEAADLIRELSKDRDVRAVGVACAGFVDKSGATVLFAPNLAWRDEPLKRATWQLDRRHARGHRERRQRGRLGRVHASASAGRPTTWCSSPSAPASAAASSWTAGCCAGAWGVAAELGHVRVVPDGIRCGCGNRGCWEQYASGNALRARGARAGRVRHPAGRAAGRAVRATPPPR